MSEFFENSYFYLLPNEVLIKILHDVDTSTLLNFCEVYNCDYFLQDRNVIRDVDLSKRYTLEDLSQISKKIAFEYVSRLNVNCLFWIQAAKLRKLVSRMVNLETLYAIQTNLSLTTPDTEIFSNSKIKKLGISVKRHEKLGSYRVPSVETLYMSIVHAKILMNSLILDFTFPNVKKLWVDVEEPCGREIILHCLNAETKTKIFCQVHAPIPSISFEHYWLTTYYTNRRPPQPYVMCCEKFTSKQMRSKSIFEIESRLGSWKVLEDLHCSKPFGPKDARRLYLNHNTFDNIFFEELNFHHTGPICNERCREATREILLSKCAQKLNKLCIMMCLLENTSARQSVSVQETNSFKRKRVGIESSAAFHPAENIFKNFLQLEHLELYACQSVTHHSAIQAYPLLGLFTNLRNLIIEVPITLDGSFLAEVFKKCKKLEFLRITSTSQHEKLNINLCNFISRAEALKDFRYETHRIQVDKLLERLADIKSHKLERVVLICKEIDRFSAGPLKQFLETNPQLIFLYFLFRECTEASMRMAQQTLNLYKKKHPSKVFLVKKVDVFNRMGYPIPDVHFCEMVRTDNSVATLCALKDFLTF